MTVHSALPDSLRRRAEVIDVQRCAKPPILRKVNGVLLLHTQGTDAAGVHEAYLDLGVYRTVNGLGSDLFDSLFVRPTLLQEALCTPPGIRQHHQLQEICGFLRTLPLLQSLDQFALQRLANEIEYR